MPKEDTERAKELRRERNRRYREKKKAASGGDVPRGTSESRSDEKRKETFFKEMLPRRDEVESLVKSAEEINKLRTIDFPGVKKMPHMRIEYTAGKNEMDLKEMGDINSSRVEGYPKSKTPPKIKKDTLRRYRAVFPICLSVSITCLLIYLQTQAYIEDGMSKTLSYAVSIVCETVLCYLSVSLRRSWVSALLFVFLSGYTLGVMYYGVHKRETKDVGAETKKTEDGQRFEDALSLTKKSLEHALARKESGNIAKNTALLGRLTEKASEAEAKLGGDVHKFRSIWEIALRGLLILVNALLIHRAAIMLQL